MGICLFFTYKKQLGNLVFIHQITLFSGTIEIWDKISPLIMYSVIADMDENIGYEQDDVVEEEEYLPYRFPTWSKDNSTKINKLILSHINTILINFHTLILPRYITIN